MAQFFGLMSLNAGNFDSESATDGQVLTADGSGGAAWEDAGGGGAAFAWDGITFTLGEYIVVSGTRDLSIELTNGGESITTGMMFVSLLVSTVEDDLSSSTTITGFIIIGIVGAYEVSADASFRKYAVPSSGSKAEFTLTLDDLEETDPFSVWVYVASPDGKFIKSPEIVIPSNGA